MIGEAGGWGPRSPGRGVPEDGSPTDQAPPAIPHVPGRGRSASARDPARGPDPALRVPRLLQDPLPGRPALLAAQRPPPPLEEPPPPPPHAPGAQPRRGPRRVPGRRRRGRPASAATRGGEAGRSRMRRRAPGSPGFARGKDGRGRGAARAALEVRSSGAVAARPAADRREHQLRLEASFMQSPFIGVSDSCSIRHTKREN